MTPRPTVQRRYIGQTGGGMFVPGSPGIQSATGRRESAATAATATLKAIRATL
jgi:hypothetical protein